MGGVFNVVNLHLYHYAGNNPVKYVDPDGRTTTFKEKIQAAGNWIKANHEALGTVGKGIAMMLGGSLLKGTGVSGGAALAVASGGALTGAGVVGGATVYAAGQALEAGGALTVAAGLAMLAVTSSDTGDFAERMTNPKHHSNSSSPEPKNVDELYNKSIKANDGTRWAKDSDGIIHRFSKPSNGQSHWNGSTAGNKPIQTRNIPSEIREVFNVTK